MLVSLWRYRLSGHGVTYKGQTEKGNWYQGFQALGQDRYAYCFIKVVVSDDGQQINTVHPNGASEIWLNSKGTFGERVLATDVSRGAFY